MNHTHFTQYFTVHVQAILITKMHMLPGLRLFACESTSSCSYDGMESHYLFLFVREVQCYPTIGAWTIC